MSKVNENENIQEEEVTEMCVANENVEGEVKPRFKLSPKVKTGLKIGGLGLLGAGLFFLGKAFGSRNNNSDEYEDVDYEVVEDSNEE